jgi:hypothetical protein
MGAMQAPRWFPLAEGDEGVPSPDATVPGRYTIEAATQNRGAPTLVRIDRATGRIWRKGSTSTGPWVGVPNPDPSVTEPGPDWEPPAPSVIDRLNLQPPPAPRMPVPAGKAPPGKQPTP